MIWVGGRVVPDDALAVSVRDRTFEHGLGLFETLRTWNGHPTLLSRHLARLQNSARILHLPLNPSDLPDAGAVADLVRSEGFNGDVLLRITLTGGLSAERGATLWMRAAPLPPPSRQGGALVDVGSWQVVRNDPLARHKALNYWSRRLAYEAATRAGYDEVLSKSPEGWVWEGSRTNVFLVQGQRLVTPTLEGPIVPGVMRALVLEKADELLLQVREYEKVTADDFDQADEVFLTNSVRGIIPVRSLRQYDWRVLDLNSPDRSARSKRSDWAAPGPWTERLTILVSDWLRSGGTAA